MGHGGMAGRGRGVVYSPWHWVYAHSRLNTTEIEMSTATLRSRLWEVLLADGVKCAGPKGSIDGVLICHLPVVYVIDPVDG